MDEDKRFNPLRGSRCDKIETMPWRLKRKYFWLTVCCLIGFVLINMNTRLAPGKLKGKTLHCVKNSDTGKPLGEKWIVTGSDILSDDVTHIPDVPGWNVVVVHNINQPVHIQCRACYCLDDETMQNLHFKTAELLPAGHRNRKLIGYLFALKYGAKYIYDIDHPTHNSNSYILGEKATGIKYNATDLFNQYSHFGEPNAWSNGFPSDWNKKNQSLQYYLGVWKTPLIQEQLDSATTLDSSAPPVFLGAGTLALTSTQSNALYLRDAFWALFRGLSGSPITRILRGFWAQRLLWELGGTFGFTSVNNKGSRIYSDNSDIGQVVSFIQKWRCPHSLPFYGCVIKLAEDTIQFGAFSKEDVKFLKLWLNDMFTLSNRQLKRCEDYRICDSRNQGTVSPVQFWPSVNQDSVNTQRAVTKHLDGIKKICPSMNYPTHPSKPFQIFPNILLIVVFNYPKYYSNIQYLETLYRGPFPNILYCGDKFENFQKADRGFDHHVSFLEVDTMRGRVAFRCLLRAIEMNYIVDGYLYMGDDVLINPWTLKSLDQKKIWHKYPRFFKIHDDNSWAKSSIAFKAWLKGLRSMETKSKKLHKKFTNQWKQNVKRNDVFYQQYSDIVYIPRGHAKTFLQFAEYFSRYPTHVEITVPNVVAGMDSFNNYVNLTGNYLSLEERKQFQKHFNKSHNFLHSVKTGPVLKTVSGVKFFCDTYFPFAFKSSNPRLQ